MHSNARTNLNAPKLCIIFIEILSDSINILERFSIIKNLYDIEMLSD